MKLTYEELNKLFRHVHSTVHIGIAVGNKNGVFKLNYPYKHAQEFDIQTGMFLNIWSVNSWDRKTVQLYLRELRKNKKFKNQMEDILK
jgi:hypothetical protein